MLDQIEVHLSDLSSFLSRATLLHSSPHLLPAFTPDPAVSLRKFSAQLPGLDLVAVRDAAHHEGRLQRQLRTASSRCRQFPEMGDVYLCVLMVPENVLKLFERLYEVLRRISVDIR